MEEVQLSEKESFALIQAMIMEARRDVTDNSFYFLLWGWLVLLAAIAEYILMEMVEYPQHYLVWAIMMPLGGIASFVYYLKNRTRAAKIKTYTDIFISYIWMAFYAGLALILFFMPKLQLSTYPMLIMLYGIGTFVTGGAIKFRPLIIGGALCWAIAAIAFMEPFSAQLLLLALAILISYIIPGHLLKAKSKNAGF